jgi:hypothetical protein
LEPAHALIRNQPPEPTRQMVLSAFSGRELAVAYLPDNDAIEVNLAGFPAPLAVRWFDPVAGRFTPVPGGVTNQGVQRFTPPRPGEWVLMLEARRTAE